MSEDIKNQIEFLKEWKSNLEKENEKWKDELKEFKKQENEFRWKKTILEDVLLKLENNSDESIIQSFKKATNYDEIVKSEKEKRLEVEKYNENSKVIINEQIIKAIDFRIDSLNISLQMNTMK